jgi:Zn finger protein HypA/HybF involved in hydrogenase expression
MRETLVDSTPIDNALNLTHVPTQVPCLSCRNEHLMKVQEKYYCVNCDKWFEFKEQDNDH